MTRAKRRVLAACMAVGSIAVDQLVKHWAKVDLAARTGGTIPILQDVFHLTYVENRGAAFGILQDQRWLFLVLTAAVALVLCYILFFRKGDLPRVPAYTLPFTLGGALGNFIDRLLNGYVVDMFDARIIGFAVFNVADICLVCSVIALAVWMIASEFRKKKDETEDEAADTDHN